MIIKKEYRTSNAIRSTIIDNIDKVDSGMLDNGKEFINVYKSNRKKEDDFETIVIDNVTVYVENNEGKTLSIYRDKR